MIQRFLLLATVLAAATAAPAKPHVVLVSVDTLRADHLGCYGYGGKTSPFFDELAKDGLLFEETYVPLPATGPSHASMLTSVLPWRHGVLANGVPLDTDVDTLAQAFRRAGYRTAASVAVSHIGRGYGFDRGFDALTEPDDVQRAAPAVRASVRKQLDDYVSSGARQPLFLFVHFFDLHYPYRWWDPADKNENAWNAAEMANRPRQLARYDDGIRHVDAALRALHADLRRALGDDLVFAVTSDHGEQIGDHGLAVGHADLYRETIRVPLIVAGPGVPKGRVPSPVSSMDVGVSLLKLAGGRYAGEVDGRDLLEVAKRDTGLLTRWLPAEKRSFLVVGTPTYTQSVALIEGTEWYIRNFDHLYRWVSTAVPVPVQDRSAWREAPLRDETGGTATYNIPFSRHEPYVLTIDHVAKNPDCEVTMNVVIAPVTPYLDPPLKFRGSARVVVPAARNDGTDVQVTPASCAGTTVYSVARYEGPQSIPNRQGSRFYGNHVGRKNTTRNELYDIAGDPRMLRNRRSGHAQMARKLREHFDRVTAAARPKTYTLSDEEKKKLKSLGYIQ